MVADPQPRWSWRWDGGAPGIGPVGPTPGCDTKRPSRSGFLFTQCPGQALGGVGRYRCAGRLVGRTSISYSGFRQERQCERGPDSNGNAGSTWAGRRVVFACPYLPVRIVGYAGLWTRCFGSHGRFVSPVDLDRRTGTGNAGRIRVRAWGRMGPAGGGYGRPVGPGLDGRAGDHRPGVPPGVG